MAAQLLQECVARSVALHADGDVLRWRAPAGTVDAELLHRLRAHKADVLAALEAFEERAAILEYDALMLRERAEALALRWMLDGTQ